LELNDILKIALKGGASDIHLKPGLPPMFRVDGALVPLKNGERIPPDELQKMAFGIMQCTPFRTSTTWLTRQSPTIETRAYAS